MSEVQLSLLAFFWWKRSENVFLNFCRTLSVAVGAGKFLRGPVSLLVVLRRVSFVCSVVFSVHFLFSEAGASRSCGVDDAFVRRTAPPRGDLRRLPSCRGFYTFEKREVHVVQARHNKR